MDFFHLAYMFQKLFWTFQPADFWYDWFIVLTEEEVG